MTAYAHTWLQFVFLIYVWMLIISIILASRYSRFVSKALRLNLVAVLATLLLMSYNKILRVIIEVYSSVKLDYLGGEKVTVWLKDGNSPYLHSHHLGLTVITTLMLVCLFLPYTFLLLLGYKLYRFSDGKYFPKLAGFDSFQVQFSLFDWLAPSCSLLPLHCVLLQFHWRVEYQPSGHYRDLHSNGRLFWLWQTLQEHQS